MRAPARAAADHGLAALLGQRDARGRLPLRPRVGARARAPRRRPAVARSSTSSTRTRCSRRSSSSPSRGTSARAATRWATSRSLWSEWNGKLPRHRARLLARRRPASATSRRASPARSDLYEPTAGALRQRSTSSPRHDGFTLRDLVSYNEQAQRGQRRGQPRRHRRQPLVELRRRRPDRRRRDRDAARRQKRRAHGDAALLAGRADAPGGDELGRTQTGNNNAYCQDNEISWLDWEHADQEFLAFCAQVVAFRNRTGLPPAAASSPGAPIFGTEASDIGWFRPDRLEMTTDDWQTESPSPSASSSTVDAPPDLDRPPGATDRHLPAGFSTPNSRRGPGFLLPCGKQGEAVAASDLDTADPVWPAFAPEPETRPAATAEVVVAARSLDNIAARS